MKNRAGVVGRFVILGFVSLAFLAGCGGGSSQSSGGGTTPPLPRPSVTSISPDNALAGGSGFTLTVNGTNFVSASRVNFAGMARTTTFVSATRLTADIPAAAIALPGSAGVSVTNPGPPGGGTSNGLNFTIVGVPGISALFPSCAPVGGQAFTLFLLGSNFVANSIVQWNGSDRPTVFVDSLHLSAQISAADIAAPGPATVTVVNPPPAGTSNSLVFTPATGGTFPQSVAVDPLGKFVYVADNGCLDASTGNVSMYTINPATGALTSIGSPVDADFGPRAVTVEPFGKFLYLANDGGFEVTAGSVSTYAIDALSGALTLTQTIQGVCPGLCAPFSIDVDPTGKFAYVANEGGLSPTAVSMFTIDPVTGALTSTGSITADGRAVSVAVDPAGRFVYVANLVEDIDGFPVPGVVSIFSINPATGALTSLGNATAGFTPSSVAVDPAGNFVYVANMGEGDISMYTINGATGGLDSIGSVAAGAGPISVAVHPGGMFAYVVNSGEDDVFAYSINLATGALNFVGTVAAGSSPSSIAIDPTGQFAYVANSGDNTVSMYTINAATGALTLIGTIGT